jgi:hypothetical protein
VSPRRRRTAGLILLLVLLLLLVGGAGLYRWAPGRRVPAASPVIAPIAAPLAQPGMAPFRRWILQRPILPADLHGITADEARAFARLGMVEDGDSEAAKAAMAADDEAFARAALSSLTAKPGQGRPYASPDGGSMRIAPPARRHVAGTASDEGSAGAGASATDGARTILDGAASQAISSIGTTYSLDAPGVWAGITHHAGDGPVRISDRSGAGHAIRINGDDFGTVRVNGGIVVPGRFYRVGDGLEITAAVPIGIDVVPLDATVEHYDEPFRLPVGAG